MLHTFVAVPSVCLAQVFRLVKLPETVVNTDVISVFLLVTGLELALFIPYWSIQHGVQCPASLSVKLNRQLEFWTLRQFKLLCVRGLSIRLVPCLFLFLLVWLFYLHRGALLLVVEVRLGWHPRSFKHFPQACLVIKTQGTSCAQRSLAVNAFTISFSAHYLYEIR